MTSERRISKGADQKTLRPRGSDATTKPWDWRPYSTRVSQPDCPAARSMRATAAVSPSSLLAVTVMKPLNSTSACPLMRACSRFSRSSNSCTSLSSWTCPTLALWWALASLARAELGPGVVGLANQCGEASLLEPLPHTQVGVAQSLLQHRHVDAQHFRRAPQTASGTANGRRSLLEVEREGDRGAVGGRAERRRSKEQV